ncbi:MAG TPA: biotin/lipoyl-containing protein [Bryobacteraceae bacterium]|nr:biotin/lipoyl-containing protein [Bryobacteraceae bacterium]
MKWQIVVDGRATQIDHKQLESAIQVEPGVFSVLIGGRSFEVRVLPGQLGTIAEAQGRRFNVEVRDPRNASRSSKSALGSGRQNITAPMPGKVIRVLVNKGDVVESGQGLAVVEAMKMQNEMKAPRAAHVMEVRVRDGDTVGAGETLVVLE